MTVSVTNSFLIASVSTNDKALFSQTTNLLEVTLSNEVIIHRSFDDVVEKFINLIQ